MTRPIAADIYRDSLFSAYHLEITQFAAEILSFENVQQHCSKTIRERQSAVISFLERLASDRIRDLFEVWFLVLEQIRTVSMGKPSSDGASAVGR